MKKDWMVRESDIVKDDDQVRILMATLDKSLVVSGCAGSGKSVLALMKAQRIQKEKGNDYSIIVYTKALCKYMNTGRQELGLTNSFNYYWQWKNIQGCPAADYIIVDEIQDFTEEEIDEFVNAARKNFFFFGDTAQSIYEDFKDTIQLEDIRTLLPKDRRPKEFELYRNYRLPVPIAKYVQYIGVDINPYDEKIYMSKIGNKPHVVKYNDSVERIKDVSKIIKRDDLEDVAILVPSKDDMDEITSLFDIIGQSYEIRDRHNDTLNFNSTNPKILTYHSAKGLQFETVFLPMVEDFSESDTSLRKIIYVAMTRTYKDLYIFYSDEMPSMLSAIPKELYYENNEVGNVELF